MRENGLREGEEALLRGMRLRAPRLRNYLAMRIPSELRRLISAEDVLQEVWIAAFQGLSGFRADGEDALDRWLTCLAQRKMVNAINTATRVKRGGRLRIVHEADRASSLADLFARVVSPGRTPSSEAAATEAVDAMQIAIASLPDARREAIWMRFIEGRSPDAIAQAMGRTKSAVNGLLFHGLRQLQAQLGNAGKYLSDAASSDIVPAE
ncbi:MAG: RNA polymerase sigma factor [Planctomycetota bacterium]